MCPKSPITYCQLLWMENTNIIISYILACTHIQTDYPLIKKKKWIIRGHNCKSTKATLRKGGHVTDRSILLSDVTIVDFTLLQ